jgi:DNA repair protein RadA/Sms
MLSDGLKEISKTSDIFLPHKEKSVSGSSVACIIEGIRPMLVEVQALVSRASFANVRRRTIGFDNNRFSLLTAIIEKRLKLPLVGEDIFLNVAGGLRINDPAADLSAVVAVLSSFKEQDIPLDTAFIAEVGLAGEFRTVSHMNMRLKTVEQSNFSKCYIPKANKKGLNKGLACEIIYCDTLDDFYNKFFI